MNTLSRHAAIIASGLICALGGGELAGSLAAEQTRHYASSVDTEQELKQTQDFIDGSTLTGTIGGLLIWGTFLAYFKSDATTEETNRRL